MARPRLILLANYAGPYEGSFIPMVRGLADAARRDDWEVRVGFSRIAEGRIWYERVRGEFGDELWDVPDEGRRETAAWLSGQLAAQSSPTVIHTHFTRFDLPAVLAARRHPDAAALWHVHTPPFLTPRAMLRNRVKFGLFGRRTKGILASGPEPASIVVRAGAPADRVHVVGGGIDTERFQPAGDRERRDVRSFLEVPDDSRVLLHFAWNWDYKDGDLFLETMSRLRDDRRAEGVLGLSIGNDPRAREGIRRLGLGDSVRAVEQIEDTSPPYAAADMFVSTSRIEGQPFAVIEAIASGLPVVASDLPGHRDICDGLESCRVVDRSPDAIAAAIRDLLDRDPADAARATAESRRRIVERFELRPWATRMVERYRAALPS